MSPHDDVSEKTLSIIAMINTLNLLTPSLLHAATYLHQGSSISLLSICLNPLSDAWPSENPPMHNIYINSDYGLMSLL